MHSSNQGSVASLALPKEHEVWLLQVGGGGGGRAHLRQPAGPEDERRSLYATRESPGASDRGSDHCPASCPGATARYRTAVSGCM